MTPFPPPPGMNNRNQPPSQPRREQIPLDENGYVPPPPIETPSGKLTDDETSFILKSSLLPHNYQDPNVLRFIASYMRCRSASQAAKEAGLDGRAGHHLRTRPDVHHAITRLTEKSVMKYGFDATEVVERVKEISQLDPLEFENPDGSYKKMSQIAPEARRAIKRMKCRNIFEKDPNGMRVIVGEIIEIELWDKMKAHELLGREKDIFKETRKVEHDVTSNMKSFLLESRERAEKAIEGIIDVTPKLTGKTDG